MGARYRERPPEGRRQRHIIMRLNNVFTPITQAMHVCLEKGCCSEAVSTWSNIAHSIVVETILSVFSDCLARCLWSLLVCFVFKHAKREVTRKPKGNQMKNELILTNHSLWSCGLSTSPRLLGGWRGRLTPYLYWRSLGGRAGGTLMTAATRSPHLLEEAV